MGRNHIAIFTDISGIKYSAWHSSSPIPHPSIARAKDAKHLRRLCIKPSHPVQKPEVSLSLTMNLRISTGEFQGPEIHL